jgi:hypothetical protein
MKEFIIFVIAFMFLFWMYGGLTKVLSIYRMLAILDAFEKVPRDLRPEIERVVENKSVPLNFPAHVNLQEICHNNDCDRFYALVREYLYPLNRYGFWDSFYFISAGFCQYFN